MFYVYCAFSPLLNAAVSSGLQTKPGTIPVKIGLTTDPSERRASLNEGFLNKQTGRRKSKLAGFSGWALLQAWQTGDRFDRTKDIETRSLKFFKTSAGQIADLKSLPPSVKLGDGTSEIVLVHPGISMPALRPSPLTDVVKEVIASAIGFAEAHASGGMNAYATRVGTGFSDLGTMAAACRAARLPDNGRTASFEPCEDLGCWVPLFLD